MVVAFVPSINYTVDVCTAMPKKTTMHTKPQQFCTISSGMTPTDLDDFKNNFLNKLLENHYLLGDFTVDLLIYSDHNPTNF